MGVNGDLPRTDAGAKPDLGWLPVSKLRVDPSYQRTLEGRRSQKLIERIVERFNWSAFQAVVVTSDPDGWVVIDGQHRVEAARRRGETHVPAVIIKALSVAEQAGIFVAANQDRVAMNPVTIYRARLAAGEMDALAVQRVCAKAGLEIIQPRAGRQPATEGKIQTTAIGALTSIVTSYDEHVAEVTVSVVTEACRDKPSFLRANLLRAAAAVIHASNDVDACATRLREGFGRIDIAQLFTAVTNERQDLGISELMALERGLKRLLAPQRAMVVKDAPRLPPEEARIDVTTLARQDATERFAKLVRSGAPIERIAAAFGMPVDEARKRATALEMRA